MFAVANEHGPERSYFVNKMTVFAFFPMDVCIYGSYEEVMLFRIWNIQQVAGVEEIFN
jgi:hypothetical protein